MALHMRRVSAGHSMKPSPKVASLLGGIAMEWSQLEFSLQVLIWQLAETDQRIGRVFTYRKGVESWLEMLIYLINLRYTNRNALEDWRATHAAIKTAQDSRNSLTHSLYSHAPRRGFMRTMKVVAKGQKLSKHLERKVEDIGTTTFRKIFKDIHEARVLLGSWEFAYVGPDPTVLPTIVLRMPPLPL